MALAFTAAGSASHAQTALTNGVTLHTGALSGSYTTIDLGSTSGTSISSMPLSLSYANVNVGITFTGVSGVSSSGDIWNPTPGQSFLVANGTATLQFSSTQAFFAGRWSSPDNANMLSFYNGSQLLASLSGAQFRSASGVSNFSTGTAAFNFSELGYDRVVMEGSTIGGSLEMGAISFSDQAVDVAPIPLNAASLGGLMSFLMMLAMRGKGGTQIMVRMVFASIMPRRRGLA